MKCLPYKRSSRDLCRSTDNLFAGDLPESINELGTDQETRELTTAEPDPGVPEPATSIREPREPIRHRPVRMESVELPEVTEATRRETDVKSDE